jgi:hypothetical protein
MASAITQFLNFAHLLCAQLEVEWFSAAVSSGSGLAGKRRKQGFASHA